MKIGICAAAPLTGPLDTTLSYIGVDRGVETLLENGITPMFAIGDFDSLKDISVLNNLKTEQLPTKKDITDTQFAIEYAIKLGYQQIDVYGVTGGRMDHFIAVLCLLVKYRDMAIRIIDSQNCIRILRPGEHKILASNYTYFSLFAITDSYIDIYSCQYPLLNYHLKQGDPLCISNQVLRHYSIVKNTKDIICIESKDSPLFHE